MSWFLSVRRRARCFLRAFSLTRAPLKSAPGFDAFEVPHCGSSAHSWRPRDAIYQMTFVIGLDRKSVQQEILRRVRSTWRHRSAGQGSQQGLLGRRALVGSGLAGATHNEAFQVEQLFIARSAAADARLANTKSRHQKCACIRRSAAYLAEQGRPLAGRMSFRLSGRHGIKCVDETVSKVSAGRPEAFRGVDQNLADLSRLE